MMTYTVPVPATENPETGEVDDGWVRFVIEHRTNTCTIRVSVKYHKDYTLEKRDQMKARSFDAIDDAIADHEENGCRHDYR